MVVEALMVIACGAVAGAVLFAVHTPQISDTESLAGDLMMIEVEQAIERRFSDPLTRKIGYMMRDLLKRLGLSGLRENQARMLLGAILGIFAAIVLRYGLGVKPWAWMT